MPAPEKRTRLRALRRHVARLERRLQWLERLSHQYSRARMTLVLAGLLTALVGSRVLGEGFGWLTLGGGLVAFLCVAACHGRVKHSVRQHQIWLRLKATHVARMTLDWSHIPLSSAAPPDAGHAFATDLNLTGARSLHQLMDTTMSQEGSARLRTWLLSPVLDPGQMRTRQDCVRELVPRVTFRDRLALYGALVTQDPHVRWEGEALRRWLERPAPRRALLPWVILLGGLAGMDIVLGVLYALSLLPALWVVSFVVYVVLYQYQHRELGTLFVEAFHLEKTLDQFRAVLLYLETCAYGRTPQLATLCAPFWQAQVRPSAVLKKIARIAGAASIQQGNIVGPLVNALVPWDLYFAHRFVQCKAEVRAHLPVWLETWYDLEALNALAHFGYVHPDYVFPEVLLPAEADLQPVFDAQKLGHPLLPDAVRVGNDFVLEHLGEIVMVTGSNMSGKSTFLRTLGVNLCLAFSGAPVNASTLRTIPFRLFTCITVSDSVTDGISYFYAEVQRLKALLAALKAEHPVPLFFLIDEIFRGTNNRERLLGSRAYIHALAGGHGVGVVSTHDLELVKLVHEVEGVRNVHFRDDIRDGRMVFAYTLRSGPCPTTNALTIMRLEGLPVPSELRE
jgi:MutS domain V